jgi:tetratricopeptide (TPR) repeat protein
VPPPGAPAVPGYEIQAEVGRGGFGVVYRAVQTNLGRTVALKMLRQGALDEPEAWARFRREAEAIARLQHPGIVQVHEVGEHQGHPYFSLEFCPGGSLEKKLQGAPLPPAEAAALVRKLAEAVQAAHDARVIHRDLKPANVLLGTGGTPKIADFGLAKKLDEQGRTQTGAILGTAPYMSPEQASGSKAIGPAADVYALGAILYECLTGRPPFLAATAYDTILQVISDDPVPPRRLQPGAPRDLETICLKCLQKDPAKRYGSAEALADDLRRYLDALPILARPVGRPERLWRWCRRRPAVASLVAVSLLLLAGGMSGVFWQWRRAEGNLAAANEQRDRARENFRLARQAVRDYCVKVSVDERLNQADLTDLRKELLRTAARFHEKFREVESDDPDVQAERAEALFELGFISEHVGSKEEALRHYAESQAAWESLVVAYPGSSGYKVGLANCLNAMAYLAKDPEPGYRKAIAVLQEMVDGGVNDPEARRLLARIQRNLSLLYVHTRRFEEAEELYGRALPALRSLVAESHADLKSRSLLADCRHELGYLHFQTRRYSEADEGMREALALREQLVLDQPSNLEFQENVVWSRISMAELARRRGKYEEADQSYAKAEESARRLAEAHASVPGFQDLLSTVLTSESLFYQAIGQSKQAERAARHWTMPSPWEAATATLAAG